MLLLLSKTPPLQLVLDTLTFRLMLMETTALMLYSSADDKDVLDYNSLTSVFCSRTTSCQRQPWQNIRMTEAGMGMRKPQEPPEEKKGVLTHP